VWLSATADIASVRTKLGAPKSCHVKRALSLSVAGKEMASARVSLAPSNGKKSWTDEATSWSFTNKGRTSPKKKGQDIKKHLTSMGADFG